MRKRQSLHRRSGTTYARKNEIKNKTGIYNSQAFWIPRFQNMLTELDTSRCGTKQVYWLRQPYWYTRKVKEAIHIRLNPNNIDRDNGAEIPEAWMPTVRKHQSQRRKANQRTPEETMVHGNNSRIKMHQLQQTIMIHNAVTIPVDPITWRRHAVNSRNIAIYIKWLCHETTKQIYFTIMLILNLWVSQLVQVIIYIRTVHATATIKTCITLTLH